MVCVRCSARWDATCISHWECFVLSLLKKIQGLLKLSVRSRTQPNEGRAQGRSARRTQRGPVSSPGGAVRMRGAGSPSPAAGDSGAISTFCNDIAVMMEESLEEYHVSALSCGFPGPRLYFPRGRDDHGGGLIQCVLV